MARIKRLTPGILKRIISEEKTKIESEKLSKSRVQSRKATRRSRSTISDIKKARNLRLAEVRLKRSLVKISNQRKILKNKIYREL